MSDLLWMHTAVLYRSIPHTVKKKKIGYIDPCTLVMSVACHYFIKEIFAIFSNILNDKHAH